ncbi:MAG: hypothetical protein ACXVA6_09020, partial [Isosphaeraceae bacterium]
ERKATLLHAEYHRPAGKMPLLRHCYDPVKLYQSAIGRHALGDRGSLTAVLAHKQPKPAPTPLTPGLGAHQPHRSRNSAHLLSLLPRHERSSRMERETPGWVE